MISTIEIYKAIRERLETNFENIIVNQKDDKNLVRPSFYIQYVGKNFNQKASEFFEDTISFNIVYFAEKEEILELLEVEETCTRAFKTPLIIEDDTNIVQVEINALNSNVNEEDYFLSVTLDIALMQHMADAETGFDIENIGVSITNGEHSSLPDYTDEDADETMQDLDI